MEMESPLDVTPTASYEEGFHCSDPFSIPDLLKRFDYGSAANKIEAILAKKSAINKCATDIEEESPNTVTGVAVPVVVLSSDDEDNGSRRSLKLYQKAVSEPTSDPHQHVMEDETPNNVTAVAPPIAVLSSDDEDNGSRSPVHLYQKFVFEPVGRVLRRNVTQSAEGKDKSKELETPPREFDSWISKDVDGDRADNMDCLDSNHQLEELETLLGKDDTGIDIDVDVGTTSNVDFSESKDEREELEIIPKKVDLWLDKDVDIGAEDNMDCVDSIDQTEELENLPGKIDVGIAKDVADNTDYLESKAQREELETLPGKIDIEIGKDINVGAAYHMMMGKWNQRASEKEDCNYQTSYEDTVENIECIAPSLEVGFLADNMDVETDKRKHVNEEHENKVVGEGDYETVQIKEQYLKSDSEEDDVAEMWKEMAMGECSKVSASDSSELSRISYGEDCDHCFILKDDLGLVCRICGIVQKGIETIFEFQFSKAKRTRTYMYESRNANSTESTQNFSVGLKSTGDDFMETEIHAHPRHRNQMKPHQVEGFNFLASNLLTDNPGGCILAHAPGSGKTFLIISFVQSFLARFPHSRPLIVLPKGILATWKKEFLIWQVEDIPLHDFYTSKADNRSQQLDVLKQWVEQKSILLLGYQQFSTIMCDNGTSRTSVDCQEILLKVPSILILDEGHTPRNEDTNILQSLARVQTPLKVVLSGTLYQNHVKEVFNILNLVRPNFLKLDTSRAVVKRIMSRVQISGVRKQFQNGTHAAFFDLVEHTLQKDADFRRRVSVIQDLREMTRKVLHYYKGDSLDELPGLVDFTVVLNLSSRQKLEVKKLKKLDNFKKASVGSLVYMHPELKSLIERYSSTGGKGSEIDNEKIDKLLGKMNVRDGVKAKFFLSILGLCESTGEKLLVFSQYIPPLKFMERLAVKEKGWSLNKEIFMITGDSNAKDRERSVERFNTSADAKVFFGSIKACGEGISLVGASRILIMDVQLNPSVTRQAIGRSFRPGQKKRVYVYRLVAADSPEEEDHFISCRKDLISKMWFEWSKSYGNQDFGMKTVDVNECADMFLESEMLQKDIKVLQKR